VLEAGWGPVSYRQNTELYTEAWHWNAKGTWSDPDGKGYFVGDPNPSEMIRYSYGYPLPRRGVTRDDGTETVGYSRLTDGDTSTYWKSNPYLSKAFTGEDDSKNPQWIFFDLANVQNVDAIRIADIMNGNDVGMVQGSHGPRFLFKPPKTVGFVGEGGRQNLQGHIAQQASVARTIDLSHATGTDESNDLVGTELCFRREGHWARELYP